MVWSKTKTSIVIVVAVAGLGLVVLLASAGLKLADHKLAANRVARRVASLPVRCTNSLGMVFTRVTNTEVLFCIWKTRVQDFTAFTKSGGYVAGGWPFYSVGSNGWSRYGDSWESPGFIQSPACPVSGVSWDEAEAFCDWLTRTEHESGDLNPQLSYRLPTDEEWSAAVTKLKFPWGSQWPPLDGTANLCGVENAEDAKALNGAPIKNYHDGFAHTSPVGSFGPNPRGLFDMAGNLQEWCADWYRKELNDPERRQKHPSLNEDGGGNTYRVLRGSSWIDRDPGRIASNTRNFYMPQAHLGTIGFRVVLALETNLPAAKN